MSQQRRPLSQSNYARGSWWATHAAELIGAIAGFLGGLMVGFLGELVAPAGNYGWLPVLGLLVGGLGVRWAVGRQFRSEE
jgi:hypothetical protein